MKFSTTQDHRDTASVGAGVGSKAQGLKFLV